MRESTQRAYSSQVARLGVLSRAGVMLMCGVLVLGGCSKKPTAKREPISVVELLPPPPPPPPPPPKQEPPKVQEPPKEEKMLEQPKMEEPERKPEPAPPKVADEPPPLGTGIKGNGGADGFGLKYGSGMGGNGTGRIGGSRGSGARSRFGWYASQVQSSITEALRNNRRTRNASLRIDVRIWPDATGRINRAQLASSTGDPALDAAIQNEVLTGLRLPEPPPKDMPLPIVMRLNARRPN
ncbi:TonB C-terminal domain-containing protein [Verrucomicrobiota bacterium sgz303538]